MYKKSGFIAGKSIELSKLKVLRNPIILKAFAEGENEGNEPPMSFEALIAAARKEEKDKLYPRIEKLETENKNLTKSLNDALIDKGTAQKKVEELEKALETATSDKVKDLEGQLAQAQKELKEVKDSTPKEEDIRAKVEAEYEVKYYRDNKLRDGADDILDVFHDEVKGATKEEIDASFENAKEKTIATKKQLGLIDEDGNPVKQKTSKTTSNTEDGKADDGKGDSKSTKRPPASNPKSPDDEGFDFDYVQSLDPASNEYKEFRKKMGLK